MAVTTSSPRLSRRGDPAAAWRHFDPILVGAVVLISALGVLMVYSATRDEEAAKWSRQAAFDIVGLGVMAVVAGIDYRKLRDFAPLLYLGTVLLLLAVLSPLGSSTRGAQAWFELGVFQLQPSEMAKVALIVAVAAYCASFRGEIDGPRLLSVLGLAAVPLGLIYLQPDLGTAMVFVAFLMGMLLVAGARPRHMAGLVVLGVVAIVAVFQLGILKEYQVDRLGAFLDPAGDTQRSAYNLNQSKIAIGSGGITGKGLFEGTQTNLSYVPEQETDFIFTVVGEELGLLGSGALLALFAVVVWRIWRAAALAKDQFGSLVCIGVLSMFVFQIFENVGMTMGIMPITGIPLPFMSYGGSATIAYFSAIGIVLNVHMRRFS
jgi:rod shape determining protein RodA